MVASASIFFGCAVAAVFLCRQLQKESDLRDDHADIEKKFAQLPVISIDDFIRLILRPGLVFILRFQILN
jgi:hypothetical protein